MGNCQAAEVATVVIEHPGNKVERIYWPVAAHDVMSSNPGHYVALVVSSPTENGGVPVKQLKLLRPDDSLIIGQVYRLVSFEDVLKEFAAKKSVKLGKLLKDSGGSVVNTDKNSSAAPTSKSKPRMMNGNSISQGADEGYQLGSSAGGNGSSTRGPGRNYIHIHGGVGGHIGQWRPALQSIAEIGI